MSNSLVVANNPVVAFAEIESSEDLPELVAEGYPWFSGQNRKEAMSYAEAFLILSEQTLTPVGNLWKQRALYKDKIIWWMAKDMAERTSALVQQETGYTGMVYHHEGPISRYETKGPVFTKNNFRYQWVYKPIENYQMMIPPQAVCALWVLEEQGLIPTGLWVGDLHLVVSHKLVDPVLCAQFGSWFVGLAEWV